MVPTKLVVGLTGGIGSGKSRAGRAFEAHGITVIDADAISRALTAAGGAAITPIRSGFGADFIDPHGALDRARMRALAFADPAAKRRLESILHPMVREESDRQLAAARSAYVILMIPLLVESGQPRSRCSRIIVVDCPEPTQIERVTQRDHLQRAQIEAIVRAQASRGLRLSHADYVLDNSGTEAMLEAQVACVHRILAASPLTKAGRSAAEIQPDIGFGPRTTGPMG